MPPIRHRLVTDEPRSARRYINFTPTEVAKLEAFAERAGLTFSAVGRILVMAAFELAELEAATADEIRAELVPPPICRPDVCLSPLACLAPNCYGHSPRVSEDGKVATVGVGSKPPEPDLWDTIKNEYGGL